MYKDRKSKVRKEYAFKAYFYYLRNGNEEYKCQLTVEDIQIHPNYLQHLAKSDVQFQYAFDLALATVVPDPEDLGTAFPLPKYWSGQTSHIWAPGSDIYIPGYPAIMAGKINHAIWAMGGNISDVVQKGEGMVIAYDNLDTTEG